ncbi:MAG: HmuY family protein [Alphaproteobacteria bacterium]|nr:HmuY family protein [Alphaproteobacteria bacterium]
MRPTSLFLLALPLVVACGDKDDGSADSGTGDGGDGGALECEATEPACVDALISDLSFQDDEVSEGAVTTSTEGSDFVSIVDATAGGYTAASQNPWVYVRFTADGLEKVEIDDEDSLDDLTWDLGMRRYLVRVNGGDSGPGCVQAATLREKAYADVGSSDAESLESGGYLGQDDFYTDSCEFINDSSGLEGSPNLVLGQWWSYPGCVATSGYPHIVQTNSGAFVKLVIEEFYEDGQDGCNSSGVGGDNGGMLKIRWQML